MYIPQCIPDFNSPVNIFIETQHTIFRTLEMLLSLGKICLSYCEIETRKVSFQILLSCLVFAGFYFEKEYRLSWVRFIRGNSIKFY